MAIRRMLVRDSFLPFASKMSLIRDILRDQVPQSVDSRESSNAVRSLLSRQQDMDDDNHNRLPVAAVVRSAMSAALVQVASATSASPFTSKSAVDGLPMTFKPLKGARRYYKSSSPDFELTQSSVPRELTLGTVPNMSIGPRVSKSLDEQCQIDSGLPLDFGVVVGSGILDTPGLPGGLRIRRVL